MNPYDDKSQMWVLIYPDGTKSQPFYADAIRQHIAIMKSKYPKARVRRERS